MKVAVLIDPLHKLKTNEDTTLYLVNVGIQNNIDIDIFHHNDLSLINGEVYALTKKIEFRSRNKIKLADPQKIKLKEYDALFIRIDPPISMQFYHTLTVLKLIEKEVFCINTPSSILGLPEKILPSIIYGIHPNSIITSNIKDILDFKEHFKNIVIKPLYNYCGNGIYISKDDDRNLISIIEYYFEKEALPIIAQEYLPSVSEGDRRIIMLGGNAIGAINRLAPNNDYRCNMAKNGTCKIHTITKDEKKLCDKISEILRKNGLNFVGVDIIGNYITEINTTAPTGVVQINKFDDMDIGKKVWSFIKENINGK